MVASSKNPSKALARELAADLRSYEYKRPRTLPLSATRSQAYVTARHLLPKLFPHAAIKKGGRGAFVPITLEELGTRMLGSVLERRDPALFTTRWILALPYETHVAYARAHKLPIRPLAIPIELRDAHAMLEGLTRLQPQTPYALRSSYEFLRKELGKKRAERRKPQNEV